MNTFSVLFFVLFFFLGGGGIRNELTGISSVVFFCFIVSAM